MCGILGVVNTDGSEIDAALVHRMRDKLYHRGPDDEGMYIKDSVALGHRRLSIIDLSESGRQPMTNEDQTVHLVFNGEIYNYLELMDELKNRGHQFHSTSDSEVIIHQYEEDGIDFLEKLNGMFSFVLWDQNQKRIVIARDRLGIKPLYYFSDHNKIIIASEIKAIIEDPYIKREPNYQGISDYYFSGKALSGKTIFKNINELEPGNLIIIDLQTKDMQVKPYWDVEYNYNYSRSEEDLHEELLYLLDDSVKVHCRSDAPLGCHLSGGLDTSTIVALAARHREDLKTFSIKFSDEPYIDETEYAKAVSNHVSATYYEDSPTGEDFAELLPYLVWHMDMPMATGGGFSYYTVSKLAQKHIKVSLTGHGGDELFAGYPPQFKVAFNRTDMFGGTQFKDPHRKVKIPLMEKLKILSLESGLSLLSKKFISKFNKKDISLGQLWIDNHCRNVLDKRVITNGFFQKLNGYSSAVEYVEPLSRAKTDHVLDKVLYHDQRVYLPSLLHLEDRASMANSIESRVPFLDHRIVEFLATVPPEQKVKGLRPKYLMRKAASTILPEKVWKRSDKRAFPVPGKFWMSQKMVDTVQKILLSPSSLQRGIFQPRALHYASKNDISMAWVFVNIELWFKIFIDQDPVWTEKAKNISI